MEAIMQSYQKWLDSPALSEAEWEELNSISSDEKEIKERFYAPLEFGTAGLRGTMKVGLHNMNIHIIRHATQAFAEVILEEGPEAAQRGIAIDYDCRNNSSLFAKEAACVMAANGIHVRIFDSLRPTPELSFAIINYGCTAGLNITASHNPKEYNGYKVYWSDGAQLPPQKAKAIADRMEANDIFDSYKTCDFNEALSSGTIEYIGAECDELFLGNVLAQCINKNAIPSVADNFSVVYTPFHGCGYKLVPEALKRLGIKKLYPVEQQMVIDGNFPTVVSPNPENPEGFYLAAELAKKVNSSIIIGTDPDSDRIGVMVKKGDGYVPITGNQLGVLLLDYIINARVSENSMPENPGVITSIVTTNMVKAICSYNNIHWEDSFTGFKFMAERVAQWEAANSFNYILAYEESYGYMIGNYVRDKDAVTASALVTEMAAYYFAKGMTLYDALIALFNKYGFFAEKTLNIVMPGVDGIAKMKAIMDNFRTCPPDNIAGTAILRIRDYSDGSVSVPGLGKVDKTPFFGSNVLYFELEDDTSFIVRPSGTEPKIKLYVLTCGKDMTQCESNIEKYYNYAMEFSK